MCPRLRSREPVPRAPEEGRKLLEMVTARLNCEAVMMEDLVPSLAVHGGPGVLGLAFHQV